MHTAIVEVTNGDLNWGKFLVGYFDEAEWARRSALSGLTSPLLQQLGWQDQTHVLVLDLQTGEGAMFRRGGHPTADLDKHRIWVCPMFEPFLTWLYTAWDGTLDSLPATLDLPDAPFALHGYRRTGPTGGVRQPSEPPHTGAATSKAKEEREAHTHGPCTTRRHDV